MILNQQESPRAENAVATAENWGVASGGWGGVGFVGFVREETGRLSFWKSPECFLSLFSLHLPSGLSGISREVAPLCQSSQALQEDSLSAQMHTRQ